MIVQQYKVEMYQASRDIEYGVKSHETYLGLSGSKVMNVLHKE
jgi:hypothetical protein